MQILNCLTVNEIKQACFQCQYKGYTISCSNMFGRYETIFWDNQNQDKVHMATDVPDAINKINNL